MTTAPVTIIATIPAKRESINLIKNNATAINKNVFIMSIRFPPKKRSTC